MISKVNNAPSARKHASRNTAPHDTTTAPSNSSKDGWRRASASGVVVGGGDDSIGVDDDAGAPGRVPVVVGRRAAARGRVGREGKARWRVTSASARTNAQVIIFDLSRARPEAAADAARSVAEHKTETICAKKGKRGSARLHHTE